MLDAADELLEYLAIAQSRLCQLAYQALPPERAALFIKEHHQLQLAHHKEDLRLLLERKSQFLDRALQSYSQPWEAAPSQPENPIESFPIAVPQQPPRRDSRIQKLMRSLAQHASHMKQEQVASNQPPTAQQELSLRSPPELQEPTRQLALPTIEPSLPYNEPQTAPVPDIDLSTVSHEPEPTSNTKNTECFSISEQQIPPQQNLQTFLIPTLGQTEKTIPAPTLETPAPNVQPAEIVGEEPRISPAQSSLAETPSHPLEPTSSAVPDVIIAITTLSDQIDVHTDDPQLWLERAALWESQGDIIAAISDLIRASRLSDNNMQPWRDLHRIYSAQGLKAKAAHAQEKLAKNSVLSPSESSSEVV